jgi:nitrogen fixation/metabolism regulation signal transduction histidine kinase
VSPDFFDDVASVERGTGFYHRLGVVVRVQRQYVWMLVSVLVFALAILAVVIATTLARGMSRPLRELSGALERVAGGDLATRLTPSGARELRRLGDAFNVMTARLESAREQLVQAEREAAWREVARRLAHEIKNPLTPMRLSLHRLQRRVAALPAEARTVAEESLAAMLVEVEHLSRLAEQFSQYARLPEPRFEALDLGEVVRQATALHEPGSIDLADGPAPAVRVRGDRLLLSRAIQNLLLNAREASPPDARVEIRIEATAERVVVEILDRGAGLGPEVEGRVFEPYVSTKRRGSGLGLSLVRDIATQHHGTVTLENREGGGACARLSLPRMEPGPESR